MKDLLMYGINGFSEYMNQGTVAVFVLAALIYLVICFLKKGKEELSFSRMMVRVSAVLFLMLLLPGLNGFLKRLNPTENVAFLFLLIPSAVLLGMTAVELYGILEQGEYGRFSKPGLFVGGAVLVLLGLTSPFLISTNRLSPTRNPDKVEGEIYNIVQIVGEDSVLLPERFTAQIGEISPTTVFANEADYATNEGLPASIAQTGLKSNSKYVIVEKDKLTEELLSTMNLVMSESHYYYETETEEFYYYKKGTVWELTQHSDDSGSQAVFYTLYNQDDGTLIVVDGGWTENAEHVRDVINGYGGHVTAWILTHFHEDHIGAFNQIYGNLQGITIDDIYVSNYDKYYDRYLEEFQYWDNPETFELYMKLTANGSKENIHHPKRGGSLDIDGLYLTFYNTYDEKLLELYQEDMPNNCGLVFRVNVGEKSVLFMGDMYAPSVGEWMLDTYGEELKSDYVNLCHHGNSIMPETFYEGVLKENGMMLFDAPNWLLESDDFHAKALARWCDENGYQRVDFSSTPNTFYLW